MRWRSTAIVVGTCRTLLTVASQKASEVKFLLEFRGGIQDNIPFEPIFLEFLFSDGQVIFCVHFVAEVLRELHVATPSSLQQTFLNKLCPGDVEVATFDNFSRPFLATQALCWVKVQRSGGAIYMSFPKPHTQKKRECSNDSLDTAHEHSQLQSMKRCCNKESYLGKALSTSTCSP